MTKKKTVFVLGAGASFEFGLPLGEALKGEISERLSYEFDSSGTIARGDGLISEALSHAAQTNKDASRSDYLKAARSIAAALPTAHSIDNHLHNHNHNEHVKLAGKLGIVRSILIAERASHLYVKHDRSIDFSAKCSKTWAARFIRVMTEQCNLEGLKDRLASMAFIVFNYDRCLEHFLTHAVSTSYGISLEAASDFISELEIYHPYGTVGNLPWMGQQQEVIEFGGSPDVLQLYRLAQEIKTFTEGTSRESDILAIRTCMKNADRLVFLGYAYHQINMDLLLGDTPKSETTRRVFGTAKGMSHYNSALVRDRLDAQLFAPMATVDNNATCFDLFDEYSMALSFT